MRILIFEDSEHNLVSAREFSEKLKGEHEVTIVDVRPGAALRDIKLGKYDVVLTDLYMEMAPGKGIRPFGMFAAMKALQYNVPVAIVTDGVTHGDDPIIKMLDAFFLEGGNERIRVFLVDPKSTSEPGSVYYSPVTGVTSEGKGIKDWGYCFQSLMQNKA